MKIKRLLKFYFSADSLERAFDKLIVARACSSGANLADGAECAEYLIELIWEKSELQRLWAYLDGVIAGLSERDCRTLRTYSQMRYGLTSVDAERRKEIRRAAVKFRRRARRTEDFYAGVALVGKYYAMLR